MHPRKLESLEFHYTPTPQDYVTCLRDFSFHDRRTWITLVLWLMVTMGIIYFFLIGTFGQGLFPGALVFIFPILFLYNFFTAPNRIGRQVKGNPAYTGEVTWRVDAKGILIVGPEEENLMEWSKFSKAREITDHFLLFQAENPRIFQFVPKRAFETPTQEEAFRGVLLEHIQG